MKEMVWFCVTVRAPAMGLPSNPSTRVFDWWVLTKCSPRVEKSPTWAVARPPIRVVRLVTRLSMPSVEPPPGALRRE